MRKSSDNPAVQLGSGSSRHQSPLAASLTQPGWRRVLASSPPQALAEPPESREARIRRLEAILFLAREPLNSRRLAQFANLADGTEARTLIRLLNQRYDELGRAFRVEEVAAGFQLLTRPMFANWLRRQEHLGPEERLSPPAIETLAVVAYRQPVLRADIEAIRGVSCGEMLRQLMERELVRVSGRSDELGRPYLYSTTKRFLRLFGLPSLDALPQMNHFTRLQIDDPVAASPHPEVSKDDQDKEPLVTVTPAEMSDNELMKSEATIATTLPISDRPANGPRMDDDDFEDEEEEEEFEEDDDYEEEDDDWEEDEEDDDDEVDDDEVDDDEEDDDYDEEEDDYEDDDDYEDEEDEEDDDDEDYEDDEDDEDEEWEEVDDDDDEDEWEDDEDDDDWDDDDDDWDEDDEDDDEEEVGVGADDVDDVDDDEEEDEDEDEEEDWK